MLSYFVTLLRGRTRQVAAHDGGRTMQVLLYILCKHPLEFVFATGHSGSIECLLDKCSELIKMNDCVRAIVGRIADGRAVQIFMCIMPLSVRIRTRTSRINARTEFRASWPNGKDIEIL